MMNSPKTAQVHVTLYTNMTSDDPSMTLDEPRSTIKKSAQNSDYTH